MKAKRKTPRDAVASTKVLERLLFTVMNSTANAGLAAGLEPARVLELSEKALAGVIDHLIRTPPRPQRASSRSRPWGDLDARSAELRLQKMPTESGAQILSKGHGA